MRLSKYFLPVLRETPAEAQIASHRLMLRAGMIRQAQAGIYSWLPLGFRVLAADRADRARGAAARRPHPAPDADAAVGRPLARERALRRLRGRDAADQGPPPARHALRPDQRGADHRHLPLGDLLLQGPAADALPHPVEVPRRGAAAVRGDARARVPDEGRLQLRPDRRGRAARLQPPHGQLHPHLRADGAEGDPDARRDRADRRRPQPRVPGAGADRRERGLLRPGDHRPDARRPRDRLRRPRAGGGDRRDLDRPLRPHRRAPRPGRLRRGAGGAARRGARHRGRADLLLRHQVFRADEGGRGQRGGRAGAGADGLARHRRQPAGRARSSRRATTRRASSGPRASPRSMPASSTSSRATPRPTRPARRSTPG